MSCTYSKKWSWYGKTNVSIADILSLVSIIFVTLLGILQWRSNSAKNKADIFSINADTIEKLSEQINKVIEDNEKLHAEVDKLKEELRSFRSAYSRARRYILDKLPGEEIPDFFITTDKLLKK